MAHRAVLCGFLLKCDMEAFRRQRRHPKVDHAEGRPAALARKDSARIQEEAARSGAKARHSIELPI